MQIKHRTITYRHSWRKWQRINAIREAQGLSPWGGRWQVSGKASVCMLWDQSASNQNQRASQLHGCNRDEWGNIVPRVKRPWETMPTRRNKRKPSKSSQQKIWNVDELSLRHNGPLWNFLLNANWAKVNYVYKTNLWSSIKSASKELGQLGLKKCKVSG